MYNTAIDALKAMKRDWTPDKYVKGVLARNSYGASVNPDDPNAVQFCASGMLHHITGSKFMTFHDENRECTMTTHIPSTYAEAYELLSQEMHDLYGEMIGGVVTTNDGPDGYEKIMAAIDNILIRALGTADTEDEKNGRVLTEERELVAV
jgi:hypothetical protein